MFHSAVRTLSIQTTYRFALMLIAVSGMLPASAQIVAQSDFEDGTTQGWVSFNGASVPVNSTAASESGTHSLLTTTGSTGSGGPSIALNSVLLPGATYTITGFLRLTNGEASTSANFTIKRSDPSCSGGTCFDTIGTYQVPVNATGFAMIGGNYTVSATETGVTLYAQLVGPTTAQSFYLDNVVITEIAPPPGGPQDNTGISTTFEDGALDGWSGRAAATLTNTSVTAHGGTHSLLITGRSANYDGPQISVNNKMYNGSQYSLSVWIKLLPTDSTIHTINMSLQVTLNGTTSFPSITGYPGVAVTADGNWHQINVPKFNMSNAYTPGQAFVYLQTVPSSGSDLVSFYIDDFQLTYLPPPTIQTNIPSIFQTLSYYFRGRGRRLDRHYGDPFAVVDETLQQHRIGERYEVEFGRKHEGNIYLRYG